MSDMPVRTSLYAADLVAQVTRLLTLDKVWTEYLDTTPAIPTADVASLERIGEEMSTLLARWPEMGVWLRETVESLDADTLEARYDAFLSDPAVHGMNEERSVKVRAAIEGRGGVRTYLLDSATILQERAGEEIAAIKEKLEYIKRDGAADGDISWGCAAAGVLVGAAVSDVLTPWVGVPAGLWVYDSCAS
jgi:hypothetical protein